MTGMAILAETLKIDLFHKNLNNPPPEKSWRWFYDIENFGWKEIEGEFFTKYKLAKLRWFLILLPKWSFWHFKSEFTIWGSFLTLYSKSKIFNFGSKRRFSPKKWFGTAHLHTCPPEDPIFGNFTQLMIPHLFSKMGLKRIFSSK